MNWKEIEGRGEVIINLYSVYQMYGLHLYAFIYYFTVMTVWVMNTHSHSKLSKKMVFLVHGVHGTGTYF